MIHPKSELLPPFRGTFSVVLGVESWKEREEQGQHPYLTNKKQDKMAVAGVHSKFTELRPTSEASTSQSRAFFLSSHATGFPLKST